MLKLRSVVNLLIDRNRNCVHITLFVYYLWQRIPNVIFYSLMFTLYLLSQRTFIKCIDKNQNLMKIHYSLFMSLFSSLSDDKTILYDTRRTLYLRWKCTEKSPGALNSKAISLSSKLVFECYPSKLLSCSFSNNIVIMGNSLK